LTKAQSQAISKQSNPTWNQTLPDQTSTSEHKAFRYNPGDASLSKDEREALEAVINIGVHVSVYNQDIISEDDFMVWTLGHLCFS
jgi:hypothetical protein